MTCKSIALAILSYPDWLTAFGLLLAAAIFGAPGWRWCSSGGMRWGLHTSGGGISRRRLGGSYE